MVSEELYQIADQIVDLRYQTNLYDEDLQYILESVRWLINFYIPHNLSHYLS